MHIITAVLLAGFGALYVVGFVQCMIFEIRLRKSFKRAGIPLPSARPRHYVWALLGVAVVPFVVGGVFLFLWNPHKRWTTEMNMVNNSLEGNMSSGALSWRDALKVQHEYALAYVPVRETP